MEIIKNKKRDPLVISITGPEIKLICQGLDAVIDRYACSTNIYDQVDCKMASEMQDLLRPECPDY